MICRTIQTLKGEIQVYGFCDAAFAGVLEQFEINFREREEVGASVCVTQNGKIVVDLWGGVADAETRKPWTRDTMAIVWSSTKGATSICMTCIGGPWPAGPGCPGGKVLAGIRTERKGGYPS